MSKDKERSRPGGIETELDHFTIPLSKRLEDALYAVRREREIRESQLRRELEAREGEQ